MSSNETMKNKLVNSMRMTKAGTSNTSASEEEKEESAAKPSKPAKKTQPRKKAATSTPASTGYSSGGCRVWPD